MSDEQQKKKSLSEISHLFLSSVRDNATNSNGNGRPKRLPPGAARPDVSVDLTPEEFAQVYGGGSTEPERPAIAPVSAIIGSHLNGKQFDRVKEYARHLAAGDKRIGLIEVDASEFRVMCFDRGTADTTDKAEPVETYDARQMSESLDELAWDIDHWLLLLPNPRTPEAHTLLRDVGHWVLLSTCDHDGVVSCYRAIKGLLDGTHRPRLTLSLLNPADQTDAGRVYRKIAGVCEQFLSWPMEAESAVQPVLDVAEHLVLLCRPNRDKAAVATAPQWQIVADFLKRARADAAARRRAAAGASASHDDLDEHELQGEMGDEMDIETEPMQPVAQHVADMVIPTAAAESRASETVVAPQPVAAPAPAIAAAASVSSIGDETEITDLPTGETTEAAVLAAVLKKPNLGLIECPVRPPTCPNAVLAVNRDRRLVIVAVTRQGLAELRSIGQAYRWVNENRPLLSMALPQFSIDAHAMPCLRLLVDRADLSADLLQPMLESGNVTVQTYRKLKWGGKTGLLLEAA